MNRYETAIGELAERYRVFCFYSFGSRSREVLELVRGERESPKRSASDIDIGVHYKENFHPSLDESIQLEQKLEDLFDSRVDLIDIVSARIYLALEIIRGELLFCSDEDLQSEYELLILRRAEDLAGYERERRKMILGGTIK